MPKARQLTSNSDRADIARASQHARQRLHATMADVARRAGVSAATVSYVLNGGGRVSENCRERVLKAAKELEFRPNPLARGLRQGQVEVLGLLLADISNPFYPEIAAGVVAAAREAGYQVFLEHTGPKGELQADAVRAMRAHRCAGLIFTSLTSADRHLLQELLEDGLPVVQLVRRIDNLKADFVGIDDKAGGYQIVEHLLTLGHRDIAVLAGPSNSSASRARFAGFRQALADANLALPTNRFVELQLTMEAGYQGACDILQRARRPPTAMVCGNDVIALGVIDALTERGLRVPEDVSVTGYDDMSFAASARIQLTTVNQPRHQLGSAAVSLLLERLAHPESPAREILLPHRLVLRATTAPPSSGSTSSPLPPYRENTRSLCTT